MKTFICAVVTLAAISYAAPSLAQVGVRVGEEGVGVRIGEPHRHHHGWYRSHAECRVVKMRRTRPDGTTVTSTRRDCD